MSDVPKIAVVGSGVIGLASGLKLAQEYRGAQLTVISDSSLEEQTSWGPPGLFGPTWFKELPRSKRWIMDSKDAFMEIYKGSEAINAGVQLISRYIQENNYEMLLKTYEGCKDFMPSIRWLSDEELNYLHNPKRHGLFMTSFTAEGRKFTPYLMTKLQQLGCNFEKRKIFSLSELKDYDYVINCSGVGARELAHDEGVQPMRGVFIEVHAPWVKHVFYHDYDPYAPSLAIPGMDRLFLGTVRQIGRYDRTVTAADRESIWSRVLLMMPNLKQATVLGEWCGLRPHRNVPRVELEILRPENSKPIKVIHNYGHSSMGFTLSLGCAKHVQEIVAETMRYSKL